MVKHVRPRAKRTVPLTKAIVLLVSLVLVATGGGLVSAGLILPAARAASQMLNMAQDVFDEMGGEIPRPDLAQISTIHWPDGELMATFYDQNRIVVPLEEIAQVMQDAVIAIEDERFFEHNGVDARAVLRAAAVNLQGGSLQGASTLTMQYVKNRLIDAAYRVRDWEGVAQARRQDMPRKAREMAMAIELEETMTKYEILEGYLNIAPFGHHNIFGVEAAARFFFGTTAAELTLVEAATIAGITQAPGRLDPSRSDQSRQAAQRRRNMVLLRMRENDFITQEEYDVTRAIPIEDTLNITPLPRGCTQAGGAAFFCNYVQRIIETDPAFGATPEERSALLQRGGIRIYTTLDRNLQAIAEETVEDHVPAGNDIDLSAAIVAIVPGTGRIVAMAQNAPFDESVNPAEGTTAINYTAGPLLGASGGFQSGSVFKNFVLAEWLRSGGTLREHVDGSRRPREMDSWQAHCLEGRFTGNPWDPNNAEGHGMGPMTVIEASARSVNTAFADMSTQIDLCHLRDTAWEMGFRPTSLAGVGRLNEPTREDIEVFPSMILGTQSTSPLALAAAHGTLASEGTFCEPYAISRVVGPDGNDLPLPADTCNPRALEFRVATTMNFALEATMTQGTARNARLSGGRPHAGKTGTNQGGSQTWFAGYTPQLSTVTWVGSADGEVVHRNINLNGRFIRQLFGGTIAAPMWRDFMNAALYEEPHLPFSPPDPLLVGVYVPLEPEHPEG
ncbi:MAG: penicillin-binding protein, partial [Promicromonosporaceae bacterium]|nr:penicillin-binding protein [Promicromonosporaceae bacterium]